MVHHFDVVETSQDGLTRTRWTFVLDGLDVVLNDRFVATRSAKNAPFGFETTAPHAGAPPETVARQARQQVAAALRVRSGSEAAVLRAIGA